jgi:hypothetical protein
MGRDSNLELLIMELSLISNDNKKFVGNKFVSVFVESECLQIGIVGCQVR